MDANMERLHALTLDGDHTAYLDLKRELKRRADLDTLYTMAGMVPSVMLRHIVREATEGRMSFDIFQPHPQPTPPELFEKDTWQQFSWEAYEHKWSMLLEGILSVDITRRRTLCTCFEVAEYMTRNLSSTPSSTHFHTLFGEGQGYIRFLLPVIRRVFSPSEGLTWINSKALVYLWMNVETLVTCIAQALSGAYENLNYIQASWKQSANLRLQEMGESAENIDNFITFVDLHHVPVDLEVQACSNVAFGVIGTFNTLMNMYAGADVGMPSLNMPPTLSRFLDPTAAV